MKRIWWFLRGLVATRGLWLRSPVDWRNVRALWLQSEPDWLAKHRLDLTDEEAEAYWAVMGDE